VTWTDNDLEKLYVWAKSLQSNLPKRPNDGSLDLGAEVELTHLRIDKSAEVGASLAGTAADEDPLSALPGAGGALPDPQTERLSTWKRAHPTRGRSTSSVAMPSTTLAGRRPRSTSSSRSR